MRTVVQGVSMDEITKRVTELENKGWKKVHEIKDHPDRWHRNTANWVCVMEHEDFPTERQSKWGKFA